VVADDDRMAGAVAGSSQYQPPAPSLPMPGWSLGSQDRSSASDVTRGLGVIEADRSRHGPFEMTVLVLWCEWCGS
jgi:hypothetical protein